jgi:hypothetical protein
VGDPVELTPYCRRRRRGRARFLAGCIGFVVASAFVPGTTYAAAPSKALESFKAGPSTKVGWTDMADNANTFRIDSITACGAWTSLATLIFTVHTTTTAVGPSIVGRSVIHNVISGVGPNRFWAAGDPTVKGLLIATLQADKAMPALFFKVSGIHKVGASPSLAQTLVLRATPVASCPPP